MSNAEIVPIRADETAVPMSLKDLAVAANIEHEQVVVRARQTLEHALRAGEYLTQIVDTIEPGGWLKWADANLTFTTHTASIYLRLAHYRDQLGDATTVNMAMAAIKGLPGRKVGPTSKYPERLRLEAQVLRQQGLGATETARRLGISKAQIYNWETGKANSARFRSRRRQEAALRALTKQDATREELAALVGGELERSYLELHASSMLLESAILDRPESQPLIEVRQLLYKAEEGLFAAIQDELSSLHDPAALELDPTDTDHIYRLARSAAWKVPYHRIPGGLDRDDLIQAGVTAALAKVNDHDPEQGTLSTFLWARVNGAIEDEIRNNQWPKRSAKIADKPRMVELDRDTYQVADPVLTTDHDELRLVAEACHHVSPRERLIITLHSFCGITLNDLAPVYGLTPSRMTQLWQEGVRQLQASLREQ